MRFLMPSGRVPWPLNWRELNVIPTLSAYWKTTLNVSQQVPTSRNLRPPVPYADTEAGP